MPVVAFLVARRLHGCARFGGCEPWPQEAFLAGAGALVPCIAAIVLAEMHRPGQFTPPTRFAIIRGVVYVALAVAVPWVVVATLVADCEADNSGPNDDTSLCGLAYFYAVPALGAVAFACFLTEWLVRRRRTRPESPEAPS